MAATKSSGKAKRDRLRARAWAKSRSSSSVYGVYAMARAAGLTKEASAQIATASELVDDNAEGEHVEFGDGGRLDLMPTAHHTTDIENRDEETRLA